MKYASGFSWTARSARHAYAHGAMSTGWPTSLSNSVFSVAVGGRPGDSAADATPTPTMANTTTTPIRMIRLFIVVSFRLGLFGFLVLQRPGSPVVARARFRCATGSADAIVSLFLEEVGQQLAVTIHAVRAMRSCNPFQRSSSRVAFRMPSTVFLPSRGRSRPRPPPRRQPPA